MEYTSLTSRLVASAEAARVKHEGYFADVLGLQNQNELKMWIAHVEEMYVGHVKLIWNPDYEHFASRSIPEIQDLNVLPEFRRRGIATHLVSLCEEEASRRSSVVGIGVGLHPGYNAAQKLYPKLGYRLDGKGVFYDNVPAEEGQSYRFDDSLVIHFTKELKK